MGDQSPKVIKHDIKSLLVIFLDHLIQEGFEFEETLAIQKRLSSDEDSDIILKLFGISGIVDRLQSEFDSLSLEVQQLKDQALSILQQVERLVSP